MDPHALPSIAAAIAPEAVALRRSIHSHPELGYEEYRTTQAVTDALRSEGLEPRVRESGTGLVVDVGEGERTVAFRADLDALPITEETGAPYASQYPGVMHACGHDLHTAVGVGAAIALSRVGDLPGRVRFIFQPAEEMIPGGATQLVAEGVLDGVEAILAFHADPTIPPGTIGVRNGPITGASDKVRIVLTGPGGHTSRPHKTVDLVYTAARVVTDLPAAMQRMTDPRSPVAVVFGKVTGGIAENVIPTRVEVAGTVRLFDLDLWRTLPDRIPKLVEEIVAPFGAGAEVEYLQGSPPVVNHPEVNRAVYTAASEILGPDAVRDTHQSLGSEDFAWYVAAVPGALVRLGTAMEDKRVDLHSSSFDVDESAIEYGIAVAATSLLRLLD